MARKREINQESGMRLKELLTERKVTQERLSEILECSVQHVSLIVNGKRRLTEENAQIIAKQFPPVRSDWLLGKDDYKTEYDYQSEVIMEEISQIERKRNTLFERYECIQNILRMFGYEFDRTFYLQYPEELLEYIKDQKKMWIILELLSDTENTLLSSLFTSDELADMCERISSLFDSFSAEELEADKKYIVEHREEVLQTHQESMKFWEEDQKKVDCKEPKYYIRNKDMGIMKQLTFIESDVFVSELYDVIKAMILYHTQKSKEETNG